MARTKLLIPPVLAFATQIPIRISDVNYGGHLGNDAVLSIAHEARLRFFASLGYSEMNIEGSGIMMTDAIVVYTSEGLYGDVLMVEVGATDFDSTRCDLFYRLLNSTSLKEIAKVKTGIVFIDREKKKPTVVPPKFQTACEALPLLHP
jgi:acyl-CoA thioester hydrolase